MRLVFLCSCLCLLSFTCQARAENDTFPCNIQKINVESMEDAGNIIKEFPQQPVIFVGARDRNHLLAQAASEKTLRELHGDSIVRKGGDVTLCTYYSTVHRNFLREITCI